ncbi:uncharacterized protein TNCV_2636971 [Trichonephila clavipes]|uniref:Uncharacterized protein n=1 Tax=Trichonephila clavipes TaxID=2585209 RepID=A0A8X6RCE9_TRICX|nr:uncharacterized protein TNCV_2636971 [Trichonephila clavipes]
MVSWEYLWPTLHCRREAGVSPLLSIGSWYLSSASPKRHCCKVSAADKGCRIYPLDPRPDAIALYSECTPETETRSLTTPNKFAALSTETQPLVPLPESVPTTSNSEHSNAPENPQCTKRNSRNRRKRRKVQEPEIEIKMAPHKT